MTSVCGIRRRMMGDLQLNFRSFENVLQDPKLYIDFKQYCVRDLSLEQLLFIERYSALMQKTFSELGSLPVRQSVAMQAQTEAIAYETSSETNVIVMRPIFDAAKNPIISTNLWFHDTPLDEANSAVQVPEDLIPQYIQLFNLFIDEFAPMEINLSHDVRNEVSKVFGGLELEMAAIGADGSEGILGTKSIPITVFDRAKREVLNTMCLSFSNEQFFNTFTRYVEDQRRRENASKASL
ncbi:hypothetical protein HK102_004702 [Quaeritorhiza haematococci]|nr:hypothetical protein HK102_004702 [Quaeritorhiza haematococci]